MKDSVPAIQNTLLPRLPDSEFTVTSRAERCLIKQMAGFRTLLVTALRTLKQDAVYGQDSGRKPSAAAVARLFGVGRPRGRGAEGEGSGGQCQLPCPLQDQRRVGSRLGWRPGAPPRATSRQQGRLPRGRGRRPQRPRLDADGASVGAVRGRLKGSLRPGKLLPDAAAVAAGLEPQARRLIHHTETKSERPREAQTDRRTDARRRAQPRSPEAGRGLEPAASRPGASARELGGAARRAEPRRPVSTRPAAAASGPLALGAGGRGSGVGSRGRGSSTLAGRGRCGWSPAPWARGRAGPGLQLPWCPAAASGSSASSGAGSARGHAARAGPPSPAAPEPPPDARAAARAGPQEPPRPAGQVQGRPRGDAAPRGPCGAVRGDGALSAVPRDRGRPEAAVLAAGAQRAARGPRGRGGVAQGAAGGGRAPRAPGLEPGGEPAAAGAQAGPAAAGGARAGAAAGGGAGAPRPGGGGAAAAAGAGSAAAAGGGEELHHPREPGRESGGSAGFPQELQLGRDQRRAGARAGARGLLAPGWHGPSSARLWPDGGASAGPCGPHAAGGRPAGRTPAVRPREPGGSHRLRREVLSVFTGALLSSGLWRCRALDLDLPQT